VRRQAPDIETPALIVDEEALRLNLALIHGDTGRRACPLRPHVSVHRCPALAVRQISAGGTVGGVAVSRLSEAEVMADAGVADVALTSPVVGADKVRRLIALAQRSRVRVAASATEHVDELVMVAKSLVAVSVVLLIDIADDGWGVKRPGETVLLAQRVVAAGLQLSGISGTVRADGSARVEQQLDALARHKRELQQAGFEIPTLAMVTADADLARRISREANELLADSYIFGGTGLHQSLWVVATVISCPRAGTAITDAGQKAVAVNGAMPDVDLPGVSIERLNAEHGILHLDAAVADLVIGRRILIRPRNAHSTTRLYRAIHVMRDGQITDSWPIEGRDRHD
jgi:D-serine deaminase-like pyridoxal phosphate-dependent protein